MRQCLSNVCVEEEPIKYDKCDPGESQNVKVDLIFCLIKYFQLMEDGQATQISLHVPSILLTTNGTNPGPELATTQLQNMEVKIAKDLPVTKRNALQSMDNGLHGVTLVNVLSTQIITIGTKQEPELVITQLQNTEVRIAKGLQVTKRNALQSMDSGLHGVTLLNVLSTQIVTFGTKQEPELAITQLQNMEVRIAMETRMTHPCVIR